MFSLIVALIVSRLPLPPHPAATQNLVASVLALVGATIMPGVSSYACALVAAPSIGNPGHDDSARIIHKALDAGINFIDTSGQAF